MLDNKAQDSAMVALLPNTSDWCRLPNPHLTIIYAGDAKKLKVSGFNELAKLASSVAALSRPIMTKVTGLEVFGEDEKVDVIRLESTQELLAIRQLFEDWDESEWPFRPHATIGPTGEVNINVPIILYLDRITVQWGEEHITFQLFK